MKITGLIIGLAVAGLPFFSFAEEKTNADYTTVTQTLKKLLKYTPNTIMETGREISSMDKVWGTEALLSIYKNNPELVNNNQSKLAILEGLIRLQQLHDPRVQEVLIENKDNENIGWWIIELLKLDNSENEKKALAVLDGYTDEMDDELVRKTLITVIKKPELLKPYKNVLVKIVGRLDKGASSPRFALIGLRESGEISTLFDLYDKQDSTQNKNLILNTLAMSPASFQKRINDDPSLRTGYLERYRTIIRNEKEERLRALALRGVFSLLDYGSNPGSDAEVRAFLEEIAVSTTETQTVKDLAATPFRKQ